MKWLFGFFVLVGMIGAQLSPTREVITPEGLKLVPDTALGKTGEVIQSADGTVHVVFRVLNNQERKTAVDYSHSTPGGGWTAPIQISEGSDDCEPPVLAMGSEGRLLSAWIDRSVPDKFTIVIRFSEDQGKSWASAGRFPAGVTHVRPRMVTSGNAAYLCFASAPEVAKAQRLYFFRSGDGGKTWAGKDVNFKQPHSDCSQADLLARGENVWVAWCDQNTRGVWSVVLTSSSDRGETWPRDPIAVSDSIADTPSQVTFDDSESKVVVAWRGAHPGSTSFIYQDTCENGVCGTDQVLLKSPVIPLTYRITKYGNNRILLWLRERGGLTEQQKRIYWVKINDQSSKITDQQVIVWPGAEQANISQFDVRVFKETLFLTAVARIRAGDWRVLLLSRKADGEDQKSIIGGEARKELSSLELIPSGSEVGWLIQERRPRMLPMESVLNDRLVSYRLEHYQ